MSRPFSPVFTISRSPCTFVTALRACWLLKGGECAEIKRRFGTAVIDTAGSGTNIAMILSAPRRISSVSTMEDIKQGERVREYVIEGKVGDAWKVLATGTAVGHKKIDQFDPVEVSELRLRITKSAGKPVIRNFSAFAAR